MIQDGELDLERATSKIHRYFDSELGLLALFLLVVKKGSNGVRALWSATKLNQKQAGIRAKNQVS